ncbi:MAG: sulfatase [bacterium]
MPLFARIFPRHLFMGIVTGVLIGAVYFLIEPAREFRGHFVQLGSPLANVFAVYLMFGAALGIVMALLLGAVNACVMRRVDPKRFAAYYFLWLVFVLIVVLVARYRPLDEIKAIPASRTMIWILSGFAGLTAAAWGLTRYLGTRNRLFSGVAAAFVAVSAALVVLAAVSNMVAAHRYSSLPGDREPAVGSPNIILIVSDALRPDHLSAYGYDRDTSPNLSRMADEGALFLNARAHGNRTIISMPAIFTSMYPSFHGAMAKGKHFRPLPQDRTTLAEFLQSNGYTTVGLLNNVYLKTRFGLDQGFDKKEYFNAGRFRLGLYKLLRQLGLIDDSRTSQSAHYDAHEETNVAIRWLKRLKDRPYFLYVHYMETHHRYVPPPKYAKMFDPNGTPEGAMELFYHTVDELSEFDGVSLDISEDELQQLKDYYDGAIRYTDDEIGRLMGEVKRMADGRETIVIVTADHGDEFLEHGLIYHNNLVIEPLLRVPLIMWGPGRIPPATRIEPLVRHIDLFPTIADFIGVEPPEQVMGSSLLPLMTGEKKSYVVESVAEGDFCTAVTYQNWKIVRVDSTDSYHLYDLSVDPQEKTDLSASPKYSGAYAAMRKRIDDYLEQARKVRRSLEMNADDETIRELKALGYL